MPESGDGRACTGKFGQGAGLAAPGAKGDILLTEAPVLLTFGCPLLSVTGDCTSKFFEGHGMEPKGGVEIPFHAANESVLADLRDVKYQQAGDVQRLWYSVGGASLRVAVVWAQMVALRNSIGVPNQINNVGTCGAVGDDNDGNTVCVALNHYGVVPGVQRHKLCDKDKEDSTGMVGVMCNSAGGCECTAVYKPGTAAEWSTADLKEKIYWGPGFDRRSQEEAISACKIGLVDMDVQLLKNGTLRRVVELLSKNENAITVLRFDLFDTTVMETWNLVAEILPYADHVYAPQHVWRQIAKHYGLEDPRHEAAEGGPIKYEHIPDRALDAIPRPNKTKVRFYCAINFGTSCYVGYAGPKEQGTGSPIHPPVYHEIVTKGAMPDNYLMYSKQSAYDTFLAQVLWSFWHGADVQTAFSAGFTQGTQMMQCKGFDPELVSEVNAP